MPKSIHTYTYIHTYIHTYTVHIYIHNIYIYICMVYVDIQYIYIYMYVYVHVYMYIQKYRKPQASAFNRQSHGMMVMSTTGVGIYLLRRQGEPAYNLIRVAMSFPAP